MDPEKERDLWLRRLDATGRAQSRYLWITLLACLFFLTLRLSAPSTQSVSVPVLDLKLNASAVLASGGTVIGLLIIASLGAILAWSRALQEYGGESWRDYAERLDMHPNFLDLAIYTGPGKANLFGKIAYFVYPLYFTLALGESAWLQWWVLSNRPSAWWVFGITGILAWLRAIFLLVPVWKQRIERSRAAKTAG